MDMNSCKPGDKLVCRNGTLAEYFDKQGTPNFLHRIRYIEIQSSCIDSVNDKGYGSRTEDDTYPYDIISFFFSKNELLNIINDYRSFQETGTLHDGLLRAQVADKPAHLLAVTVQNAMLEIFLPYAEKAIKDT